MKAIALLGSSLSNEVQLDLLRKAATERGTTGGSWASSLKEIITELKEAQGSGFLMCNVAACLHSLQTPRK